jgi:transcription antitermination factor NusG
MEQQWHVVHVASRTEKKVAERLEKKGFLVYLPIQRRLRQWSDRKKWVDMVVLTGYVFVKIRENQQYYVLETSGVSRFLKFSNKPVVISEAEMVHFQNFIENAKERSIEFTPDKLPIGTLVTIQTGYFKGFEGMVIKHKGRHKLTVQLSHIGHFSVDLAPEEVAQQA